MSQAHTLDDTGAVASSHTEACIWGIQGLGIGSSLYLHFQAVVAPKAHFLGGAWCPWLTSHCMLGHGLAHLLGSGAVPCHGLASVRQLRGVKKMPGELWGSAPRQHIPTESGVLDQNCNSPQFFVFGNVMGPVNSYTALMHSPLLVQQPLNQQI